MASKKIKDLVVKMGTYTDRNSGQEKSRWETIGAIMQSDEDQSMFVMLKRTFNPAGVPNQDSRESILVSAFDPQPRDGSQQRGNDDAGGYQSEPRGGASKPPARDGLEDPDIPF